MKYILILEAILLLTTICVHVRLSPFTKVEESFNIQATHDLLYESWSDITTFDHIQFPGVVPRTFVGPLVLSILAYVPKKLLQLESFSLLHLVRITLGILTIASLISIRTSLSRRFTTLTGSLFTLITLTQFHILFYASRTLPNTFALILTNFAFADRLQPRPSKRSYRSLAILSVACALFRSELCTYIFFTFLFDLASGDIAFSRACVVGLSAAVTTALASTAIDSYFWNRLSYPELEVFYFNVVLNKSSAWGTHPFHWYLTNALPRSLGGSYILGVVGLLQHPALLDSVIPALLFVCIYSALPHKELRFIFYALPVVNVLAAVTMEKTFRDCRAGIIAAEAKKHDDEKRAPVKRTIGKRVMTLFMTLLCLATLGASLLQTLIATAASHWNYPSGYAMRKMHAMESQLYYSSGLCNETTKSLASVHIDVDSAMNGITRFLEDHDNDENRCPKWSYSKKEDASERDLAAFTHIISSKPYIHDFCVLHVEKIFSGLDWAGAKIDARPHTFVHRNTNVSRQGCLRR